MGSRGHYQDEREAGGDGQRECARGTWCSDPRIVRGDDGTARREPALTPRVFCQRDQDLIGSCLAELPAIYVRLHAERTQPTAADTTVHVPFGPSVPVRLDVDAAMRVTARLLRSWEARVRGVGRLSAARGPVHSGQSVARAAATLQKNLGVLLALQSGWMTHNVSLPARGRASAGRGGVEATCRRCGLHISRSPASGTWWGAYQGAVQGAAGCGEHEPGPGTIIQPSVALIPASIEDEWGDAEIVRAGADFMGLFVQRDGAAAGLELLHLHYWDRAVLRETPARPEELLGVECRSCSHLALRRAEPPWHKGDPEYYSECAECGHLMSEDEYRLWTGQLAAYHKARLAAMPVLADTPGPLVGAGR